jgi:hypothetical protein
MVAYKRLSLRPMDRDNTRDALEYEARLPRVLWTLVQTLTNPYCVTQLSPTIPLLEHPCTSDKIRVPVSSSAPCYYTEAGTTTHIPSQTVCFGLLNISFCILLLVQPNLIFKSWINRQDGAGGN